MDSPRWAYVYMDDYDLEDKTWIRYKNLTAELHIQQKCQIESKFSSISEISIFDTA